MKLNLKSFLNTTWKVGLGLLGGKPPVRHV